MLVSSSKLLALFAFFASVVAAPPRLSNVMGCGATESYPTAKAHSEVSATKKAASPLVTEVTTVTLFNMSVSGSDSIITSTVCKKSTLSVTLNPVGFAGVMSRPLPSTIAVPGTSRVATATSSPALNNGAQAQSAGGMGLAAVICVAGILAAAL